MVDDRNVFAQVIIFYTSQVNHWISLKLGLFLDSYDDEIDDRQQNLLLKFVSRVMPLEIA